MKDTSLIITIIAPDKTGIVEMVASLAETHEANWIESRMLNLAGQFAGICRVTVKPENAAALSEALSALENKGLKIIVVKEEEEPASSKGERLVDLELVGLDKPGILRGITKILSEHDANVEELNTFCSTAPSSGISLFNANISLTLNKGAELEKLKDELETLAQELMVDINLSGRI